MSPISIIRCACGTHTAIERMPCRGLQDDDGDGLVLLDCRCGSTRAADLADVSTDTLALLELDGEPVLELLIGADGYGRLCDAREMDD